jgi:hypothetical protein
MCLSDPVRRRTGGPPLSAFDGNALAAGRAAPAGASIAEGGAAAAFLDHCASLQGSSLRKYRNVMDQLTAFRERAGVQDVIDPKLERLDACRGSRNLALTTTTKEIRTLRQFLGFCLKRN